MEDLKLGVVETRFAELVWAKEPISSGDLVKLCDKGIFQNVNGIVTSILSQKEFQSRQSKRFVKDTFSGSLPAFIAAFAENNGLSDQDISEIRKMIDAYEGDGKK